MIRKNLSCKQGWQKRRASKKYAWPHPENWHNNQRRCLNEVIWGLQAMPLQYLYIRKGKDNPIY